MIWLLRDLDLLSVLLSACAFALEAVSLGGVIFSPVAPAAQSQRRLLRASAIGLALAAGARLAISLVVLASTTGSSLGSLWTTGFVLEGAAECVAALLLAGLAAARRLAVAPAVLLLVAAVAQSHAASRLDGRAMLLLLTLAHHIAAAAWLGTMPYLLLALRGAPDAPTAWRLTRSYSRLALVAAPLLVVSGVGLSWYYVGTWQGLYGTMYGLMILAKCWLALLMLALGAGSHLLTRRQARPGAALAALPVPLLRLRRLTEAEIGFGLTAILAAASLTAQSPAVDTPHDQASLHQIIQRVRWERPRFSSPRFTQLTPPTSLQASIEDAAYSDGSASNAEDRAWSEYNHHWAGLIVLACGALALAGRLPLGRVLRTAARQWPLLFAGLGVFILLRADPENWPLGPRPFWASFSAPDVLEHRFFALLVAAFALFEWGAETGRWRTRRAAYVFPLLLASGGAALLTHSHAAGDAVQTALIAISHTAIAMLGVTAGAARWLELRLPGTRVARAAAWLWPMCLVLVGVVLLNYRES